LHTVALHGKNHISKSKLTKVNHSGSDLLDYCMQVINVSNNTLLANTTNKGQSKTSHVSMTYISAADPDSMSMFGTFHKIIFDTQML